MGLARLPGPLLLITDRQQARKPLVEIVEAALLGGCRWVSIREKDLPAEERLQLVYTLLPLVHGFGGTLLVHGDVDAAMHADGVHLPVRANVQEARARLGENACIGLSCHTLEEVEQVSRARGADYVTLGPIAPTASKPGYSPTLTIEQLGKAAGLGIPVIVLGGVDETNVFAIRRTGAAGFAMMGSVMRSEDPGGLVRRVVGRWGER